MKHYHFIRRALPIAAALAFFCATIDAQAQGSVTPGNTPYTIEYWLKADNLSTPDNVQIAQWVDNANGKIFTGNVTVNTAGSAPKMKYDGMNFNPAVNFASPARRMVSNDPLVTDANRSYLTFYVSKTDLTGTTAGAVFAYRANNDEGWLGTGTGTNNLYYYNGTITNFPSAQGFAKGYGITGFSRNTGSTGAIAWHNAKQITATNVRNVAAGSGKSLIGTRTETGTPGTPFYGDIQEIIVLSTPVGTPFAQTELQKIYSYLAIKYGQSLDPTTQPNLYSSTGAMVWNATVDINYNKNLFGIARDNGTGLYQKQSTNVDDNTLTAFLGNELHQLNSKNGVTMNDMTYLLFGSNGQTGVSPYVQANGTTFANFTLADESFSRRQNRIYRVQLTGADSVNLSLKATNLKAKYIMISGNGSFTPANTRIYPINNNMIATGVVIKNGDFIGFVLSSTTPGGITACDVEYWLKADQIQNNGVLPNNSVVDRWDNLSEKLNDFEQLTATQRPSYTHGGMNFNPAVKFVAPAKRLISVNTMTTDASRSYLTFYVSKTTLTGTTAGAVFAYRANNDEGWVGNGTGTNNLYYYNGTVTNFPSAQGLVKGYGITGFERNTGTSTAVALHNAKRIATGTVRNVAAGTGKSLIGTRTETGTPGTPFYGDIQEIIVLSTPSGTQFSQIEIQKINSYLAIKYGQSLDTLTQPNLYNSAGNVVWNSVTNKGYNRNTFGVARDHASGLYQKQSVNVDDNVLTAFLGANLYTLSAQNEAQISNMTYLIFGSNGGTGSTDYICDDGTQFSNYKLDEEFISRRQNKIYKAQLTGADSLTLSFKTANIKANYIMVSGTAAFNPANTRLYVINKVGATAYNVTVKDGEYIGFAMMQKVPGGVGSYKVEYWLRADEIQNSTFLANHARVSRWENHAENMNSFVQENTINRPQYIYDGMNFHPTVNFTKVTSASEIQSMVSEYDITTEINTSRIYRSFYVSKPAPEGLNSNTSYGAVFSYRPSVDEGWYGNTQANYLYYNTTTFNPGLDKRYGITSMDRGGTVWHNAKSIGTTAAAITAGTGKSFLGTRLASPALASSFFGEIQEVIILSTTPGTPFNNMDIRKINSYLAIKYGQTLDTLSQPDLYSADGTVVWDGASGGTNKGYNRNVFGIARDEITGLYQKQSTNIEDGAITLFLGEFLFTLNEQNLQRLNNETYLLLGSNGRNGTLSYPFPANTQFANKVLPEACFNRQERLYKTQLTGDTAIIVSIKVNKFAADYVMVSSSKNFTPASTQIYAIVDGIAKNIKLAHNQYIGFILRATTPGGVNDYSLDLWLKADEIRPGSQPAANAQVKNWSNLSGTMFDFAQGENNGVPAFKTNFMNYQPSVKFNKTNRLVSEANFLTDAGRLYRTFYVSSWNAPKSVSGTNGEYGAVFAFRDNYDEGWVYPTSGNLSNYLYYNFNATAAPANYVLMNPGFDQAKEQRRYGITSFDRGYGGATSVSWHNGKTATGGAPYPVGTNSAKAILGARTTSGTTVPTNFFDGDIQEVIVLSTPAGTPFDPVKISKITTYLAVKYGQTLDTLEHPVWLSSDSTVIWKTTDHTGYNNNIFGIGRDNATGLYQKQSMSVGSREKITIYIGNEQKPSATNTQNNGTLTNGLFLMMGSNGKLPNNSGQIAYAYNKGKEFVNDTLLRNIEFRHPTVLKAHITGASSFTPNIYLGGIKADYVLVSANPAFLPLTTRIYHVDPNFVVSNILINQDEYIGFAYHQETPGGVGDQLVMWLKADEPSTVDVVNGETQEWRDFSGHFNDTYYYYNPTYTRQLRPGFNTIDPYMNFHSSVQFRDRGGSGQEPQDFLYTEKTPFSVANVQYHTIVIMMRIDKLEPYGDRMNYFMGFNNDNPPTFTYTSTNFPALGFETTTGANPKTVGRAWQEGSGGGGQYTATKALYNANATAIAMYIRHQTGPASSAPDRLTSYFLFEADAHIDSISANTNAEARYLVMPSNNIMNAKGTLGRTSLRTRAMSGTMSEVIFYEKTLTRNEKDRVYSYLGLKYGVTLDKDKENPNIAFDYFLSNDAVVWPGNSDPLHRRFHNNIAAIVRDDAARLNNLQSHSTDAGSAILMGIGQRLGYDPLLSGLNNDKEVIIWGHNGGDYTRKPYPPENSTVTDSCGDFTEIIGNRIWILDVLTQENYPVLIGAGDQGFNSGFNAFPYGAGWQVSLLIADSEQKLQNMEWDLAIPGVWTDKLHQFSLTLEAGKRYYFTFGAKAAIGDCDACDVRNRFKNITFIRNTTWRNGWTSADFLLNNRGFNANVSVDFVGTGARFLAAYPRAYSNALRMYRSRSVVPVMRTVVELDTAAIASFDLREIDYGASRYMNVTVYGECGSGIILPKLNYATTKKSSYYTISPGKAVATLRRTAAPGNRNAWMMVDFDDPVHKIVIEQTFTGRTTGTHSRSFLLGPLSFACPAPPPPVNEDGLSLSQQAMPQELRLCDVVTYTWRIHNANCDEKTGNFSVTLPQGMLWERNSLSVDDANLESATIHEYASQNTLTIDNLTLLSGDNIFRARAYFEMSALEGTYSNHASFIYDQIVDDHPVTVYLRSCDRMSLGCEPTSVVALPAPDRMYPLEIDTFYTDKSCYKAGDNVQTTLVIYNPNPDPITHVGLEISYNETFEYVLGSLGSDIPNIGVPDLYTDEMTGETLGGFTLSGPKGTGFIIIPSGQHTITFNLVAPTPSEQDYYVDGTERYDESGHPLYAPLGIMFNFETLSEEDDCSAAVFYDAWGELQVEALPDVSIIGRTIICAADTSHLSRWMGGTWSSNNPEVATVDSNTGVITGVAAGETTFSFKVDDMDCSAESDPITVIAPQIVGPDTIYVMIPESFLPESGGNWACDDETTAIISGTGFMTGIKTGTVHITFTENILGCSVTKEIIVKPSFTVTYKHNVPSPAPDVLDEHVAINYTIRERPVTFVVPPGYWFKGWNTQADGLGITYTPGQLINVTADITLYAIWKIERYLVYSDVALTNLVTSWHWLAEAVLACGTVGEYAIVATENDYDLADSLGTDPNGPINLTYKNKAVSIPVTKKILFTSDAMGPYIIKQLSLARHFAVEGELTLKNIILEGNGFTDGEVTNGGIFVNNGVLAMDSATVIRKCYTDGEGGAIYTTDHTKVSVRPGGIDNIVFQDNKANDPYWLDLDPNDWFYNPGVSITALQLKSLTLIPNKITGAITLSDPPAGNFPFKYIYNNYDINYAGKVKTNRYHMICGTVFPFVYDTVPGINPRVPDIAFDTLFKVVARLYTVPPVGKNPLLVILKSEPRYETKVVYYDGTVFVPTTPLHPGVIGSINNPGLPINWEHLGHTQGSVDDKKVSKEENHPDKPVGFYSFEYIPEGDYILTLSGAGFVTRYAKIEVKASGSLGHRELIPGDFNNDGMIDQRDAVWDNFKHSEYLNPKYRLMFDVNENRVVDSNDVKIVSGVFHGFIMLFYQETWDLFFGY